MKIDVVGRNYRVSDRLKSLIEKKLNKFEKFFDKPAAIKVVCSAEKDRNKMEINLSVASMYIRSEVESDNMYTNLDICIARLEKQVVKYIGKNSKKPAIDFSAFEYFDELPEIVLPKITKRKSFALVPMSEQDALMQMDMVGNDFFIFMNSATDSVCVLYKREDGDVGLIETK